jgi:nucleoside-diphosphate-sugar epimerase
MMETSERAGVKDWVVAGSCFEYGESGTRYEAIPVDAPLEPLGAYSTSKAAASVALSGFARDHDFKFSWHRIFHVYGPGEAPSRFWPSLVRAAQDGTDLEMSEGMQVRDFVPVEEVARQLLLACHQRPEPGNPVFLNLGTGKALTLREFAEAEWKRLGAKGHLRIGAKPMRPNEVMRFVPQL